MGKLSLKIIPKIFANEHSLRNLIFVIIHCVMAGTKHVNRGGTRKRNREVQKGETREHHHLIIVT